MPIEMIYFFTGFLTVPGVIFGYEYYKKYKAAEKEEEKKKG
jgi:hypothetical protein|tara:strand:- start:577 stop:699 length:123 start_codon:yes stop_codon:yes gene_type:complete